MPEAGRTPDPVFERGSSLDYGDATQANDLAELFDDGTVEDEELYVPVGEEEEFLFGPTERPAEPLTAGAPFGPGPAVARSAVEDDEQFSLRVAETIIANPDTGPEAKAWARRRLRGE